MVNETMRTFRMAHLEGALDSMRRMKDLAEQNYRQVAQELHRVATSLLGYEWNLMITEQPEAREWGHRQLADWIITTARGKVRRLEWMVDEDAAQRTQALAERVERQAGELEKLRKALAAVKARADGAQAQNQVLRRQLATRDARIVELQEHLSGAEARCRRKPVADVGDDAPPWLSAWRASDGFARQREALHVIGSRGFSLRADIARAIDLTDATSGTALRVFDGLNHHGLIEEIQPQSETRGRAPFLVQLSERGRCAFRRFYGEDAVPSEYERLLARHKSPEHVLLNLETRDVLLQAGAKAVDLYPEPVTLPDGATFDVDIVALFDDDEEPLYVEVERARSKKVRAGKWHTYARVTRDFYVVVPNKETKSRIFEELCTWAYRHREQAHGVRLHIGQLSRVADGKLWDLERRF